MRGDSHPDHDADNSGRRSKPPPTKPVADPRKVSGPRSDAPYHVSGEERRKRRLWNLAENVPQLLVIFTIHSLQSIELTAEWEVALEWQAYS